MIIISDFDFSGVRFFGLFLVEVGFMFSFGEEGIGVDWVVRGLLWIGLCYGDFSVRGFFFLEVSFIVEWFWEFG